MAKFGQTQTRIAPRSVLATTSTPMRTFEGDTAYSRDAKSELFVLAATNMVGEDTFYESASDRDERFRTLVQQVTTEDPKWMQEFIPYLRLDMLMRSSSVVAAAEYLAVGGPEARSVVNSALQRADEPAELLGYWLGRYGKKLPQPLKRGLADAARRLYNEYSALRYDSAKHDVRPSDVIALCHVKPNSDAQGQLFKYLIERRHNQHGDTRANLELLPVIAAARALEAIPQDERRSVLAQRGSDALSKAGFSWERLSGWLPGGMDAAAWEAVIPSMGYMALLRNLRNFEQANISDVVATKVALRLADPEQVAQSRQLPFRFYTAYREVANLAWSLPLEKALDLSCENVPALPGRTLVLVDVSGSMGAALSERSTVPRWAVGAVFGGVMTKRCGAENVDLVVFGNNSAVVHTPSGGSILTYVKEISRANGDRYHVGHGTETWAALANHYKGHDRVVIFTDEQSFGDLRGRWNSYGYGTTNPKGTILSQVKCPIYAFNLAGYAPAFLDFGKDNRYELGGFSDKTFTMLAQLERGKNAAWPWETV